MPKMMRREVTDLLSVGVTVHSESWLGGIDDSIGVGAHRRRARLQKQQRSGMVPLMGLIGGVSKSLNDRGRWAGAGIVTVVG